MPIDTKYLYGLVTKSVVVDRENNPYLTRIRFSFTRYGIHIFHRGDIDPDPHDHPWDFWTFPLVEYVEDYLNDSMKLIATTVPSFKWTKRESTYCHRVIGPSLVPHDYQEAPGRWMRHRLHNRICRYGSIPLITRLIWAKFGQGTIVTIVKTGETKRKWGFWIKAGDGRLWVYWRDYVFGDKKPWA